MDLLSRFEAKYVPEPMSGCWLWTASTHRDGYGWLKVDKSTKLAHRVSYELHKRDLAPGEVVRHSCDNPPCVNPEHLTAGTNRDNVLDMYRRNRQSGQNRNTKKTACRNGHPLSEGNLYKSSLGHRRCKACGRNNQK